MIEILLLESENGVVKELQVSGHALFAERGKDIVCAAISILVKTAGILLSEIAKEGKIEFFANKNKRGFLAFRVENLTREEKTLIRLKSIFDFLKTGIRSVEKEFPDFVKFNEKSQD